MALALGCLLTAPGALGAPDRAAQASRIAAAVQGDREPGIVGGIPVTGGFDWVVYLEAVSDFGVVQCGGSLIGEQWIVTAAHCLTDTDPANGYPDGLLLPNLEIFAVIGRLTVAGEIQTRFVYTADASDVFGYPDDFDPFTARYDVAIIRLDRPVPQSVQAIQLLHRDEMRIFARPGTPGIVAGWGEPSTGPLLATTMSIIPDIECIVAYGIFDALTQLCARDTADLSSGCYGDSGSALAVAGLPGTWLLAGSLSLGDVECTLGSPHVLARMATFTDDIVLTLADDVEAGIGTPTATTRRPRRIRKRVVVVAGDVLPAGLATTAIVEWGRTKRYGNLESGYAGAGFEHFEFTLRLVGLEPGTVYHYRVIAWNGAAWVVGKDRKLRTR